MKERGANSEQKTELEVKSEKFLNLLYKYDFEGNAAYFKKEDPGLFLDNGKPLYSREDDYCVIPGRKYVWMDAPYLRLGVTKEGELFIPKKYWSFGQMYGLSIDSFLDPELWGTVINRVHTQARRGIGRYESAVMDYHDLVFKRK